MNNVELIILSSGWLCLLLSNGIAKNRVFVGCFICENIRAVAMSFIFICVYIIHIHHCSSD